METMREYCKDRVLARRGKACWTAVRDNDFLAFCDAFDELSNKECAMLSTRFLSALLRTSKQPEYDELRFIVLLKRWAELDDF